MKPVIRGVIFAVLFMLAISFSASTAMAQCSPPYDTYYPYGGGYYCVGDGAYMDAGYGLTSVGGCAPGIGGNCGNCFDSSLSPNGICLHPPCTGFLYALYTWSYADAYFGLVPR